MRVLHVLDHSLPVPSGYSVRSHAILTEQRRLGWQVEVVTGAKQEIAHGAIDRIGEVDYRRVPRVQGRWARWPVADQLAVIQSLRNALRGLVRTLQPQLLHVHSPCLNGLAALRLGVPVLYELRSSWEDAAVSSGQTQEGSLRYRLSRALETTVLKRADAIVTICDGLRQDVIGRGIDPARISVVPNAVDAARLTEQLPDRREARAALGVGDKLVLGFAGSFFAWEGLDMLLRAVPIIRRTRPDVFVLLVGEGPESARLRSLAQTPETAAHVRFAGQVPHDQVSKYYAAMDLMLFPRLPMRLTEMVTPIKPLEAMALGKVVIASDVGGHRELLDHEQTGLLFKAGDVEALARAVLAAANDVALQQRLVAAARVDIAARRNWAKVVHRYAPVYESLARRASNEVAR